MYLRSAVSLIRPKLKNRFFRGRLRSLGMNDDLVVAVWRHLPLRDEPVQRRYAANLRRLFWLSPPTHSLYSLANENGPGPPGARKAQIDKKARRVRVRRSEAAAGNLAPCGPGSDGLCHHRHAPKRSLPG